MRRSSSTTFPSLKLGLAAVAWNAGRDGAWAKLAETARSENNSAARAILTDPQSARATVFKGRGISIGFILSSGRWDDFRTFSTRVRRESRRIHSRRIHSQDRWPSRVPLLRLILLCSQTVSLTSIERLGP